MVPARRVIRISEAKGRLSCFWETWQVASKHVEGSSPLGVLGGSAACESEQSRYGRLLPASSAVSDPWSVTVGTVVAELLLLQSPLYS